MIKNLVSMSSFAKAGGDWNTGELRKQPDAKAAAPQAKEPTTEAPKGWSADQRTKSPPSK